MIQFLQFSRREYLFASCGMKPGVMYLVTSISKSENRIDFIGPYRNEWLNYDEYHKFLVTLDFKYVD